MTQEEKSILLQDLCGRLPYNTIVSIAESGVDGIKWNKVVLNIHLLYQIEEEGSWEFVKPYLRPMSSITKEEKEELSHYENSVQRTDFYYSHHVDCRFMIEKGLAMEAPDGMYK